MPSKTPLKLKDDVELSDEHLVRRIAEEMSPCRTGIDLRYFIEIKPNMGWALSKQKQKYFRVYESGKIQFNVRATKEIKAERLRALINSAGTIIVLDPVEVGGFAFKQQRNSGAVLPCVNAAKHLKAAGIKLPAYYSVEWDEHLEAWVGRLLEDAKDEPKKAGGTGK